ncbi:hypothetical protein ASD11_06530 [Aeromicrobium sp. Root495]|uniref:hypothetical protein n=1 Tax=Aeromicrobium sp. Root495 TaxID=1736550 RepID=UPI0006F21257|nr:hypothetical protein [Aeromicrobium sp. Root495]KQY59232.1 hypothetical protein ASD11_06530 [Aeromicrobium sp. Root495]
MRRPGRTTIVSLAALPLLLVLAFAASSARLHDYWWSQGFRDGTTAAGSSAAFSDRYDDGFVTYPIRGKLRLDGVTRVAGSGDADLGEGGLTLPTSSVLWKVALHVEADPDVVLTGCSLALVDRDGRRYDLETSDFEGPDRGAGSCVPPDAPGPSFFPGQKKPTSGDGENPRPPAYDVELYVVTPDDAAPETVRVWWFLPRYVELPIDASDVGSTSPSA